MNKQEAILKLWQLAEECIKNGVAIDHDSPYEKVFPSFGLGGFSKSGTASLTIHNFHGYYEVVLKTRYDQTDIVESFDDICRIAFSWFFNYSTRSPFEEPREIWVKHFVKNKYIQEQNIKTYKILA